jgi:predicted amidophosphoribosyltransferase
MLLMEKGVLDRRFPVTAVPDDIFKRFKKGRSGLSYLLHALKKKGYITIDDLLKKRILFSRSQKMKTGIQRRNVEKSFYLDAASENEYSGEIYLIDDIYTTGSTMNHCSKLLKLAGFKKVHAVSFFRSSLFDRE